MAEKFDSPEMPGVKPMPLPPDPRIIPLDRQPALTHQQVEQVRFGLGDTGPLAQAVMNANVPALAKQLATGAVQCLSSRRPADPVVGQMIFETDTQLSYFWSGTAWVSGSSTPGASVLTPVGAIVPYGGSEASTPAGWLFCGGQAVSRSTYSALFAVVGTTYGSGDGSTTFNVPDLRGRVLAGKDDMGGTAASRLTAGVSGVTGTTLGAAGGSEALHAHTHIQNAHNHTQNPHRHYMYYRDNGTAGSTRSVMNASSNSGYDQGQMIAETATNNPATATNQTTGTGASQNVQPTIVTNYIIKALADTVTGNVGSVLTGAAGGDLSGSYPNPTVTNITNAPVHNSNTSLSFRTSGTERMSIDASGRVRTPFNPAFWVTRVSMSNLAATATLTYNTTRINIGSAMNLATGLFTAPVAGTYMFTVSAFKETTVATGVSLVFIINGTVLVDFRTYSEGSGYSAISTLAAPITLAANDTIGVQINSGTIHGNANGHFSGHLIG